MLSIIKCARLGLWLPVVAICVLLSNSGSAQTNFTQTALLRWYGDINGSSFAVGSNPMPSLSTAPAFGSQVTTDSN